MILNLKDLKNIDLDILKEVLSKAVRVTIPCRYPCEERQTKQDAYQKQRTKELLAAVEEEIASFRRNDTWADEEAASIAAGLRTN